MILFELIRSIRAFIVPLIFTAVFAGRGPALGGGSLFFFLFLIAFPMLIALMRFASYRYKLEEGHVTIREGVLSRKVRRIPVRRIHNINTSQNIIARVLGVLRLDIETAGGGSAEASLVAVSKADAQKIRRFVHREKMRVIGEQDGPDASTAEVELEEPASVPIHRVPIRDIFLAGATTSRLGIIFVGLFAATEYLDFDPQDMIKQAEAWTDSAMGLGEDRMVYFGIAAFVLIFLVAWLLAIFTAFVRWFGFTLSCRDDDLEISTGLLTIRQYTLPRDKIQALQCETSAIRRPFGLFQIRVRSAGHVGVQEQSRAESDLLVPITNRDQLGFFASSVWSASRWDEVAWHGVHPWTRLRQFRVLAVLWALILTGAYYSGNGYFRMVEVMVALALIGFAAAWGIAHLTWKQTAYGHDDDFVYIKHGFLGLQFWVIPVWRIQNVALSQTPFQRFRALASLTVDTAGAGGSNATIPNIDLEIACRLFNRFSGQPAPTPGTESRPSGSHRRDRAASAPPPSEGVGARP